MTEPLALDAKDTASALAMSERKLWELTNRGEIPHVRIGKRILYPVAALDRWLESQLPEHFQIGGDS
jgi:excisionase family DNA binding protein